MTLAFVANNASAVDVERRRERHGCRHEPVHFREHRDHAEGRVGVREQLARLGERAHGGIDHVVRPAPGHYLFRAHADESANAFAELARVQPRVARNFLVAAICELAQRCRRRPNRFVLSLRSASHGVRSVGYGTMSRIVARASCSDSLTTEVDFDRVTPTASMRGPRPRVPATALRRRIPRHPGQPSCGIAVDTRWYVVQRTKSSVLNPE